MKIKYEKPITEMDENLKKQIIHSTSKYIPAFNIIVMIAAVVYAAIIIPVYLQNKYDAIYLPLVFIAIIFIIMDCIYLSIIIYDKKITTKMEQLAHTNMDYDEYFDCYNKLYKDTKIYQYEKHNLVRDRQYCIEIISLLETAFEINITTEYDKHKLDIKSADEKGDVEELIITLDDCIKNKTITEPEIRITEDYEVILLIPYEN